MSDVKTANVEHVIMLNVDEAQMLLGLAQLIEHRSAEENALLSDLVTYTTEALCAPLANSHSHVETYYKVKYGTGSAQSLSVHCFDTLEAAERYGAESSSATGIRKFTVTSEDVR